jgi:hypothetical protein
VGDISTYSDAAGTSCGVADAIAPFQFIDVFLLHKHTGGATASQFKVSLTGGSTMTFSSQTVAPGMLNLGNANDDISIAYGGCVQGDFLILTVRYLGFGTSPACSRIVLEPAATSPLPGELAMVDCSQPSGNLEVPGSGQAIINPDGTCQCDVPVRTTTWGSIKALYR